MKIKNWNKFQHYKNRNPPWIKLSTNTFQDYDFSKLSDASKLLAVCIWTLASRSKDGDIPHDIDWIKSQCSLGKMVTIDNLNELIKQGFIIDDSNMLADRNQNACLETERETERENKEKIYKKEIPKKKVCTGFPDDFTIPVDCMDWAKEIGVKNPLQETDAFRDHHTAKGSKFVDWVAAWRNWMRNSLKFGNKQVVGQNELENIRLRKLMISNKDPSELTFLNDPMFATGGPG